VDTFELDAGCHRGHRKTLRNAERACVERADAARAALIDASREAPVITVQDDGSYVASGGDPKTMGARLTHADAQWKPYLRAARQLQHVRVELAFVEASRIRARPRERRPRRVSVRRCARRNARRGPPRLGDEPPPSRRQLARRLRRGRGSQR
jgi:hypothetical protein